MKFLAITAAALALAAAGSASAAPMTDMDYLKASRCKGLATTLTGVVDVAALDAYLKSASSTRASYIQDRAENEFSRAKREARSEDRKARLTAELTGPCSAYLAAPSNVAKR